MKLDKIKFAKLIHFIGFRLGINYMNEEFIVELDNLIDIEVPMPIERHYPDDVERLMMLMAEGMRKIEAIKVHRTIAGHGLKESKDAVERYWVSKPEPIAKVEATLGDILHGR